MESGNAYYSFDSAEELNAQRAACESKGETFMYNAISRKNMKNSLTMSAEEVKTLLDSGANYVIRFKMPENEDLYLQDIIRGEVHFNTSLLDDKVLFLSLIHISFGTGHSSTSISAALGMAVAAKMNGEEDRQSVAIIGDGAMTGGLARCV